MTSRLDAPAFWLELAPNVRGALWVLLAGLVFSVMGVLIKVVGQRLDSFEIAFFRSFFGLIAVLPFVWRGGVSQLRTAHPFKHLSRALLGVSAMFCGFYALTHLPLADAVAFTFTKPLFLIPLAVLFLSEKVRMRRWSATAVGFVGVIIMMRPTGDIDHAAVIALIGAMLVAAVTVLIKQMVTTERPSTLLFYFGIIASTIALVPALFVWVTPTWAELVMMMAIGACGALAQGCMIRGFAVGEATAIIPFDYARLIFAGGFGFVLFAETPDTWTLVGAAVVFGSTFYIAHRESRLGKPKSPPIVDQAGPTPEPAPRKPIA